MASPIFRTPTSGDPEFAPIRKATIIRWWRLEKWIIRRAIRWGDVEFLFNPRHHDVYLATLTNPTDMSESQRSYEGLIEIATDYAIEILDNLLNFRPIGEQLNTLELVAGAIAGEMQHRFETKRNGADYLATMFERIDWQKVLDHKEKRGFYND